MTLDTKKRIVIKTLWWSTVASIMGYIISFFITPYITSRMGMDAYGYVTLIRTFVEYGALVTTALNSYAVRYIGVEYHKKIYNKANEYYNSVLFADVFLGIGVIWVILLLLPVIKRILKIPKNLALDVQRLFILCFFNLAINTVMTAFSSASYLKNRLDLNYFFRVIGYVAEMVTLVLLFRNFETRLFYIGISYVVDSFVMLWSKIWMTKRLTPELKVNYTFFKLTAIKELIINGIWNSINSLGNVLNTGLDMLITSLMLSATDLGMLGVVKTFPNMFVLLYQLVSQPFQPMMLKSYSLNDKKQLKETLKCAMKISGYVTIIGYTIFVAVGKSFYELWLPRQNAGLLYRLTLVALLPNAIEGVIYPCYYIYTLCVKNKIPCFVTIIGGILNVIGMYFLIKYTSLGIYAVLLTTIIVMGVVTLITNPIYMSTCLKVKCGFFYRIVVRYVLCCFIICGLIKFITCYLVIKSWLTLMGICIAIGIFSTLIYFVIMFENKEKKSIISDIKKMLGK